MVFTNIKNRIISRKKLLAFGMLAIVLGGIVSPIKAVAQSCTGNQIVVNGRCVDPFAAPTTNPCTGTQVFQGGRCVERSELNGPRPTSAGDLASGLGSVFSDWIAGPLFKAIGYLLMTLSGGILTMIGSLFDFVVKYTIIDMAQNIGNESVGGSIRDAWRALRDIANMFFIFVLLYVAFKAVFDLNFGNVGKAISNIIIVALLINFSLFFSKVVIDASNVAAVGFYNSIITANSRSVSGESAPSGNQTISSGYMRLLGLQSWYSPNILIAPNSMTPDKILIVGIFSSVFMLITAVIFLISTVMFAARFIILVFLMILSPLALVAIVIPGMNGYFDKWKDALINQSIFAPIFFALTWVVFKIGSTPGFLGQLGASAAGANAEYIDLITKSPSSSMGLVLNYVLVIGFSIAALVISKQIASKAPFFTAISGGIGAGAIGGAAILGRQTVGRVANKIAGDRALQERVASGTATAGERAKLATAQKLAGSSFDFRGVADTKIGKFAKMDKATDILGKSSGAGGFKAGQDTKTENRRKPIDVTMRQFRDKPAVIAGYLMRQNQGDQQYMYDKLGARDRAAVNDELDKLPGGTAVKDRLIKNMSIEEQEKTDEAGKKAKRERDSKEILDNLKSLVAGTPSINPTTGVAYTYDDLLTGRNKLRVTDARKLSLDALNDDEVIKRLSPKHLADIIANKDDLDDATTAFIVSVVDMAPPYPLQAKQHNYIHGAAKDLWGV